jgi:hypothetical protein
MPDDHNSPAQMTDRQLRDVIERKPLGDADTQEMPALAEPDEVDTFLGNARTCLERANSNRDLRFWPPAESWSGNEWQATWKSPTGRLDTASYPGQVAMLDDIMTRFGVPA